MGGLSSAPGTVYHGMMESGHRRPEPYFGKSFSSNGGLDTKLPRTERWRWLKLRKHATSPKGFPIVPKGIGDRCGE